MMANLRRVGWASAHAGSVCVTNAWAEAHPTKTASDGGEHV
jgi:hypothetical protein